MNSDERIGGWSSEWTAGVVSEECIQINGLVDWNQLNKLEEWIKTNRLLARIQENGWWKGFRLKRIFEIDSDD